MAGKPIEIHYYQERKLKVLELCDNHDKLIIVINLLSIIVIKQYFIIVIIVNWQILLCIIQHIQEC